MGATYFTGAGKVTAVPSCTRCSPPSIPARTWVANSSTPAKPLPDTA
ncbi:Uncharacterised protein [Mycobacteroides abscessus subsp. abscessus]|nr:Uncharacterised protein [Mycobacteroides abscessus subsp. abscessus]